MVKVCLKEAGTGALFYLSMDTTRHTSRCQDLWDVVIICPPEESFTTSVLGASNKSPVQFAHTRFHMS